MGLPLRLDTTEITRAIDEVLDENAWVDALSDEDFNADVVISALNDDFVIEIHTDETALIRATENARAVTRPAGESWDATRLETPQATVEYETWYAAYLKGELPEPFPRARAPRATSSMVLAK